MIELKTIPQTATFNPASKYGHSRQSFHFVSRDGQEVRLILNGLFLEGDFSDTYFITFETEKERDQRLNEVKVQTVSLSSCARCGQTHKDLEIQELSNSDYSHWAPCPTNGEPILIKFKNSAWEKVELYDTIP